MHSAGRAGATMLANTGVRVNVVGTNFMDFPEFLRANGVTDAESRANVEAQVPMRRSRFTTGQFVAYAGAGSG